VKPLIELETVIINKNFPALSFRAQANDSIILRGPNGAGKSTLLKTIVGLLPIKSGIRRIQCRQIGYVPQLCILPDWLTAQQFLSYKATITNSRAMIDELLNLVGLTEAKRVAVKHFSQGMVQRLFIANALLANPDILILDEPFANIDSTNQQRIKEFIFKTRKDNQIILIASHDADTCANQIIEL
jgi:ABC-type multidrug transport system ATPase subunit